MQILTALVILAVLLCVTVALAQPATNPQRPWETWQPPAVTLPNPNGFDTYLKAFALKAEIDRAHGLPRENGAPPPPANAPGAPPGAPPGPAGDAKAGPPWPATGPPFPLPGGAAPAGAEPPVDLWGEGPRDLPLDQRIAPYADVLKLCRQAMTQECRIPPPMGGDDTFPFLAKFRAVARLFAMAAAAYRDKGDFAASANSALDGIRMAQDAATHHTRIGYLVGTACEAIGGFALDRTIPQLDAPASKAALARLQEIEARRVPIAQVIADEERDERVLFKALVANPKRLEELRDDTGQAGAAPLDARTFNWANSWQALGDYFAQERELAKQPYALRVKPISSTDPLVSAVAPALARVWLRDAQTRTAANLRIARLAAQAFLLERGRLPATPGDVVPAYLPRVPDDPFGTGPLRARIEGNALIIYSIGPDGVDDGGEAFVGNFPNADSKGDVVVHVLLKVNQP